MKGNASDLDLLTVDVLDYMFVEWLNRNNLYSKFVANLSPARFGHKSARSIVRGIILDLLISERFSPADAISSSFAFRSTPEGSAFWLDASRRWTKYFNSCFTIL